MKYVVIAPFVVKGTYDFIVSEAKDRDYGLMAIFPFLLFRMLNNQFWISLNRYKTAKGKNKIVDKNIEFEQVDRERDWYVLSLSLSYKYWGMICIPHSLLCTTTSIF